jgi:guanosine-3',5'-bis(diphosphate) 3'-pyrophosphohydrolase
MSLFARAAHFAAVKHRAQRRDTIDQRPYIEHPLEVAKILSEFVDNPITIAAAILHDTVEDTTATYEELVEQFGREIADTVMEVTDDKTLPKEERKRLQIEHAATISNGAKCIKMADKISNLRSLNEEVPVGWTRERVRAYFVWSKKVTDRCAAACPPLARILDDLYRVPCQCGKILDTESSAPWCDDCLADKRQEDALVKAVLAAVNSALGSADHRRMLRALVDIAAEIYPVIIKKKLYASPALAAAYRILKVFDTEEGIIEEGRRSVCYDNQEEYEAALDALNDKSFKLATEALKELHAVLEMHAPAL